MKKFLSNAMLLSLLSFSFIACNEEGATKYSATSSALLADSDAFKQCATATDAAQCEAMSDLCMTVYKDVGDLAAEGSFASCLPKNYTDLPSDVILKDLPQTSTSEGPGIEDPTPLDPPAPAPAPAPAPVGEDPVAEEPKLDVPTDCAKIPERFLVPDDKDKKMKKVIVCHGTGNGDHHTIEIACPALKAHLYKHGAIPQKHNDYLGGCDDN